MRKDCASDHNPNPFLLCFIHYHYFLPFFLQVTKKSTSGQAFRYSIYYK